MDSNVDIVSRRNGDAVTHLPELADAIVEQLSLGIVAYDDQLRLLVCNARARSLLALDRTAIGARLAESFPEVAVAEAWSSLSRTEVGSVVRVTLSSGRVLRWRTTQLTDSCWLASIDEERSNTQVSLNAEEATDELTGLGNRHAFSRMGSYFSHPGGALIMLDIDNFKSVNDSLGHPAGDGVLRLAGQRILSAVRSEDQAFRLGGDEFAILVSDGKGALELAKRLVRLLSRSYLVSGQVATTGASAGIAQCPTDAEDLDALVRRADLALYAAKIGGRGNARVFQPAMAQTARRRYEMEQDLRDALARKQFELIYKPQADLDAHRIAGFKTLIRWRHPNWA